MFRELALLAPAHPLAPGGELGGGEPRVRPRPLTPGGLSEEGLHSLVRRQRGREVSVSRCRGGSEGLHLGTKKCLRKKCEFVVCVYLISGCAHAGGCADKCSRLGT